MRENTTLLIQVCPNLYPLKNTLFTQKAASRLHIKENVSFQWCIIFLQNFFYAYHDLTATSTIEVTVQKITMTTYFSQIDSIYVNINNKKIREVPDFFNSCSLSNRNSPLSHHTNCRDYHATSRISKTIFLALVEKNPGSVSKPTRRTLLQFWNLKIRRATFLNYIKFVISWSRGFKIVKGFAGYRPISITFRHLCGLFCS